MAQNQLAEIPVSRAGVTWKNEDRNILKMKPLSQTCVTGMGTGWNGVRQCSSRMQMRRQWDLPRSPTLWVAAFPGWRSRFRPVAPLSDDGSPWRHWHLAPAAARWGSPRAASHVERDESDLPYFLREGSNGPCLRNNNLGTVMLIHRP